MSRRIEVTITGDPTQLAKAFPPLRDPNAFMEILRRIERLLEDDK